MDVLIGFLMALLGGIVTTVLYVAIVWRLDRHEKEPAKLLALAFLWGMLPAVIISIFLELGLALPLADGATADLFADAGVAPIVEESAKALALLAFLVFCFREFDGVLDGIVYGAMIGFGFAFTENLFYVVASVAEEGLGMGVFVLVLRSVIFGVNHAFFTSLAGAGVGAARLTRRVLVRLLFIVVGWLLAVVFHGMHNLGTVLAETNGIASLAISFVFDWGGVAILLVVVVLVWRKEQRWLSEELAAEVQTGYLTQDQYAAMTSAGGRQRLLTRTLRERGWSSYRRLGRQYGLFAELAIKKRQVRLLGEEPGMLTEIGRLRAAILFEQGKDTTMSG